MIGRISIAGVSLVCALFFCALAAQGASAAEAKNTTAFTCVGEGGEVDFSDAHCDNQVATGHGLFGHSALNVGEGTKTVQTNAGTKNNTTEAAAAVLKGTVFGLATEIECKTVTGEGTIRNEEPSAGIHRPKWLNWLMGWTNCTVKKPALGCKVKEPIEFNLTGEGAEGLGAGKNEMGTEFKPTGEHFASLKLEGCIAAGTYNVDGTAIATGTPSPTAKFTGSTSVFTEAMTKETLKLAGNAASISSSTTVLMAPVAGKPQNPISFTTVT